MKRHVLATSALALVATLAIPAAHADRKNPLEGQPSIRHRIELRALRFEASPFVGFTFLQDFNNTVMGGAKIQYHLTDWVAIGGVFGGGAKVDTGLKTTLLDTLHAPGTDCAGAYMGGPDCGRARDAMNYIQWFAAAQAEFQPFGGKFSLFSKSFFNYDFFVAGGVGFVGLKNALATQVGDCTAGADFGCNDGMKIGPTAAAGVHMFFNHYIALNLEYRAIVIHDNPAGRDTNRDRTVTNDDLKLGIKNFVTLGVSFFFPSLPEISK